MIRPVWAIARNTFREAVRNKILYILLLVAVGMILSGIVLGKLSLDQHERVIKDVGLATISLFGVVIAAFIGVNLLYQELDRKTLFTVLTKPIYRWQFVVGKYVGMLITLGVMTVVMTAALMLLLATQGVAPDAPLLAAILLLFLELTIVVALAVFFSSFSSPFLSGGFTFGAFLLGRLSDQLQAVLPQLKLGFLERLLVAASWVLPNLYRFNVADRAIYGTVVPVSYILYCGVYALAYSAVVLAVACFLFGRRDIL